MRPAKPTVLTAFAGDTVSLRISVYDAQTQPFDFAASGLSTATLVVQGLAAPVYGSIDGHVVFFSFTEALDPGNHSFYAQVSAKQVSAKAGDCYTLAYGTLAIQALPDVS